MIAGKKKKRLAQVGRGGGTLVCIANIYSKQQ